MTPLFVNFIKNLSLNKILVIAFFFRAVSAIFSEGYGMYDDHFAVIEIAQAWADGKNIGEYLPDKSAGITQPKEHSLFYPGIHYILFKGAQQLGINDPQTKMLLVRLLHAFYSLLVIYFCYKIAYFLSGLECANFTGLVMAVLWFMPNLSVRNLVEMVCLPPLLAGFYFLIKPSTNEIKKYLAAGFVIGFAFIIRYQTALFIGGAGVVLLLSKNWKALFWFSMGAILNFILFQGLMDWFLWGNPFAELFSYVSYNLLHKNDFIKGYWFNYLLLVTGLVIPPLSLMFWYGYIRDIRKRLLIFLPSFIFLVFHCYFQNKQERFILPFIPFFVILGSTGWFAFQKYSSFWQKRKLLLSYALYFVSAINIILLLVCSVASTKTSRVDAMYYLYGRGDLHGHIIEATYQSSPENFPRYYSGQWCQLYSLKNDFTAAELKEQLKNSGVQPNYVIFLSDENLAARIAKFKESYPHISELKKIQPSFIDRLFHFLNPINENEPCDIYSLNTN